MLFKQFSSQQIFTTLIAHSKLTRSFIIVKQNFKKQTNVETNFTRANFKNSIKIFFGLADR